MMPLTLLVPRALSALAFCLAIAGSLAAASGGKALAQQGPQPDFCSQDRVAGGCVTDIATFPWMVTLFRVGLRDRVQGHLCGGSVIADRWILTAAHCVEDFVPTDPSPIAVHYGSTSLEEGGRVVEIDTIYAHPGYNGVGGDDIALLRLQEPIAVRPVRLSSGADAPRLEAIGLPAVITGYGDHPLMRALGLGKNGETIPNGPPGEFVISPVLMGAVVPLVDNANCNEQNSAGTLCAGYQNQLIDACSGDSGGPLHVRDGNGWVQIGLVSGGTLCHLQGDRFSTYTRVSAYQEWIRATMAGETEIADIRQMPDFSLDPTFFNEEITSGFAPDPLPFRVQAGGEMRAGTVGNGCTGFVARAPDVRLVIDTDGSEPLRFFVEGDADTTLLINQPDGRWLCNDDRGANDLNPELMFPNPLPGQYDIWVGTYQHPSEGGFPEVTLQVSELPRMTGTARKPPL